MYDSVWILEPWYHIDVIGIMRCINYEVSEGLGIKNTACRWTRTLVADNQRNHTSFYYSILLCVETGPLLIAQ